MPKNSWNDYSTTAASNTDVHSVSTAEGMAPSDVNNALRELMVDTANFDQGNVTLTSALAVASGGTGAATHTANNVLVGAGTSAVTSVAPSTSGNVLTSNGTVWASAASPATDLTAVADGSVGSPSIANTGDTNTGIYWPGADQLGLTTAGAAAMLISATGGITKPLQPMFHVRNSSSLGNVTGDGTEYAIIWNSDQTDVGNNVASGVFTVPITGNYLFTTSFLLSGLTSSHDDLNSDFICSGSDNSRLAYRANLGAQARSGYYAINGSLIDHFTAAETVHVRVLVAGGSKVVDIDYAANSNFCGYLLG